MASTTPVYTLETDTCRLAVSAAGELLDLVGAGAAWQAVAGPCWQMTLQAPSTPSVLGRQRRARPRAAPRVEATPDRLILRYAGLQVEDEAVDLDLDVTITAAAAEFTFGFALRNRSSAWTVRELRTPLLTVPLTAAPRPALLWPLGAGERFADAGTAGVMSLPYPMRLFMPWLALDAGHRGLYLASHDASLQTVSLHVDTSRCPGAIQVAAGLYPFCGPGEAVTTAPVVVRPYAGTWHQAAQRYRRWADGWFRPVTPPAWVRRASGWQLAILKQQNGEIHWPYGDLPKLIALGAENGLDVLGLFGWTEGGHDRHYPVYTADPAMGGEAALRAGIAQAHAASQRVILYTNGQLRDLLTPWHVAHGQATAALSERGDPFGESWMKYKDGPPRRMTYGCQSSAGWAETLLALARQVEALGADGIIFDQLGSCQPMFCFSREHGHATPAQATGPGVAALLARVQAEMQAVNPEFAVLVEHVADGVNQHVDLTHGCDVGFRPGGRGFPELLRFTFPEIRATQRHPSPAMDRQTVNWACLYGFAHELEYRYWPDRLYVEQGLSPEIADYERIASPPDLGLMRRLDPRGAAAYLRAVIAFESRHAELLRAGVFRDVLDFTHDNPAVLAKAYRHGQDLGIMLWNPTDQPQPVTVTVAGARCLGADAPEESPVEPQAPLPPAGLRLLRFHLSTGS